MTGISGSGCLSKDHATSSKLGCSMRSWGSGGESLLTGACSLVSCTKLISRIPSVGGSVSERTNMVAELVSSVGTSSGIVCFAVSVAPAGHMGIMFQENRAGSDDGIDASDTGVGCDSFAS